MTVFTDFITAHPVLWALIILGVGVFNALLMLPEPIVVQAENIWGAYSFGPFMVFDEFNMNKINNGDDFYYWHEYGHYLQAKSLGVELNALMYMPSALFSLIFTGNIWDWNLFEITASRFAEYMTSGPYE